MIIEIYNAKCLQVALFSSSACYPPFFFKLEISHVEHKGQSEVLKVRMFQLVNTIFVATTKEFF